MHCLENMLVILSRRVSAGEMTKEQIADTLLMLATASHEYVPDGHRESLAELNDEWGRRYSQL